MNVKGAERDNINVPGNTLGGRSILCRVNLSPGVQPSPGPGHRS